MLELGLRVKGAPIKRHFDLSSFAKGPDGPSGAPRKRHFDFSSFAKGPDGNQELPENVTLIFRVSRRAQMDNR